MTDKEFSQCFRFTRETFKQLLNLMRPLISRFTADEAEEELEAHKAERDFQAAVKVAVFIRMMAGGSFGISPLHSISGRLLFIRYLRFASSQLTTS